MDVREKARLIAEELQDMPVSGRDVYVVSLDRRDRHQVPGRVFIVARKFAAQLVVEGTHGYATPEQIRDYETELAGRSRDINESIRREEQKFQLMLTPELIAMTSGLLNKKPKGKEQSEE